MQRHDPPFQRTCRGSLMICLAFFAFFVILPVGVLSFEISRVYLALNELRGATDAAVLAAASAMLDGSVLNREERKTKANEVAISIFRKNVILSGSLQQAQMSATAKTDNPPAGDARLNIILDGPEGITTAESVVGVRPAFADFLGLGVIPVRAISYAGGRLTGDVVLVLDVSNSMSVGSKTVRVKRTVDASGRVQHINQGPYTADGPKHAAFPLSSLKKVPDPAAAPFAKGTKLNALANASDSTKLAALVEAKAGNLESQAVFESSGANTTDLNGLIQPGPGYQDDYQRIAVAAIQPLEDERIAVADFLNKMKGRNDIHVSLICFGEKVSTQEGHNSFSTRTNFVLPQVDLDQASSDPQEVITALESMSTKLGTPTGAALFAAIAMIEGSGHRDGVAKTIILLSDGLPTHPPPTDAAQAFAKSAAKQMAKKGIRLYPIGFYMSGVASTTGQSFLNKLAKLAGNGSRAFVAPDTPSLDDVLDEIYSNGGGTALINR